MKILPHRFVTQIEYRGEGKRIILGWIGEFKDRSFNKAFKASTTGKGWSRKWTGYTGAIQYLLAQHGKDPIRGTSQVVPMPQTWHKEWKPLDFCEDYFPPKPLTSDD